MAPNRGVLAAALACAVAAVAVPHSAAAQQKHKPVVLRFAADFSPPPHPAALALEYFAQELPKAIPGSQVRIYYAGALYTIPEAFEAMRQGNLEMTWMQMGKAAPVEPRLMAVVGPGNLTTVGAVDSLEKTRTYQQLVERLAKNQHIKVFGAAHMSFGMGIGGAKRYLKPEDFTGRKMRSMGPVENASLASWRASPVVMAFGEVPSALQSGVIDGLMTSIGGWLSVKEQAPYYTTGGPGAFTGDYYMIAASARWWNRLPKPTQTALEKLVQQTIAREKELNWCVDQMTYEKYRASDPSQKGVYWMTPAEVQKLVAAVGDASQRFVKSKLPPDATGMVDQFHKEAQALNSKYPQGSSPIEKTDCNRYKSVIVIK
ncbi:MAG TPA: TRAP transporter substrate-binding protein DctP [Burkholderiales bacterium]